jgi:hypothetical protein
MRRCTCFTLIMGLLCLFISYNSLAQPAAPADSSSQQNALNNTLTLFYGAIGKQSPLFNGTEYSFYDPTIKGTAYFLDQKGFVNGSVYYDRVVFTGVPMMYDLYTDQLVVLLYNHFTKIALIQSKVVSFDILDHHFVNISADTLGNNTIIESGFYDELYKGKTQVLAKRSKDIQTSSGGQSGLESYFNFKQSYYIRKNNQYYSISGQSSLLDILKDRKKELQQYIRSSQIKFRKSPEDAMVKIASYYDHLTK